jgi:poly(3-hydroxyalkanoate) synthetase
MTVTTRLPSPAGGLVDSWLDAWRSVGDELIEQYGTMLERGFDPLALPRWWKLMLDRRPPAWSTPNEIVFEGQLARLRDFGSGGARRGSVPTLVLPPQAGHDSCIVDYSPDQSQMRTILAARIGRALTLDWVGATRATANATVDDYLDLIDRAVDHAGGRVNLIGDCQGGWLATIYAAISPERVNTLTIAGAPIDFHAGEPVIHELLQRFAPGGNLAFYEALVDSGCGVLKGTQMLAGFIGIKPADEFDRQLALLRSLDDPTHVTRYREFEDWFKQTQDIPGAFYLWIVRHLFRDNELVRGKLEIRGIPVDLRRIDMPLNLLAGASDHITPPDQVFALAAAASTPPQLVTRDITTGGHLGLFMSHEALRDHWPRILAEVKRHSGATGRRRNPAPASPRAPARSRARKRQL